MGLNKIFLPLKRAQVYREDFEAERKDRESAHAQKNDLEARYSVEFQKLHQKLQQVNTDNERLIHQMQAARLKASQVCAEEVLLNSANYS